MITRVAAVVLLTVAAACTHHSSLESTGEWRSSCITSSWWITGPSELSQGKFGTVRVYRCENKVSPANLAWSTSDSRVLEIASESSTRAVIKAVGPGNASVIAVAEMPMGRSELSVAVN
jgi:hypothetical protein